LFTGIGLGDEAAQQVMAIPIVLETGRCYAVVEFVRVCESEVFSELEFEVTNAIFTWVTACVQKMKRNRVINIH